MSIDIGTGGGRAFICDTYGHLISFVYEPWTYSYPDKYPNAVEFDSTKWWSKICNLIIKALNQAKLSPDKIDAIGITTFRQGIVLLDRSEQEIYASPNIDFRALDESKWLMKEYGEDIYKITGKHPFPHFLICRLVWLRKHEPMLYNRISTVLLLGPWLFYKLTGVKVADPSLASDTALMDLINIEWSKKLLNILEIPKEILPEIVKSNFITGEISKKASKETGLREGTSVTLGGADSQCGLVGTGAVNAGETTAVAGTSICIQMAQEKPVLDAKMRTWTHCHAIPQRWTVESVAGGEGMSFSWLKNILGVSYDQMIELAERTSIASERIMSFIGTCIHDSKSGYFPSPPTSIVGIRAYTPSDRGEIIRAFMEGTAFAIRANCEQLVEVSGLELDELKVCGGFGDNEILAQIIADVLGVIVKVPNIKEATSLGAALLAGIGAGLYDNIEEATSHIEWKFTKHPNVKMKKLYDVIFLKWLKLFHGSLDLAQKLGLNYSLL
jgi:autoinducer 2 (AI-2) kinase